MKNVRGFKKPLIYLGISTSLFLLTPDKLSSKSTTVPPNIVMESTKMEIVDDPDLILIKLLEQQGFKGEQNRIAWAIVKRESNGIYDAKNYNRNRTWDRGLFQINDVHLKEYNINNPALLFNPVYNAKIAFKISNKGKNYSAWALPNLDGSVTGYAKHLKQKAPNIYNKYYARYKHYYNKYPF